MLQVEAEAQVEQEQELARMKQQPRQEQLTEVVAVVEVLMEPKVVAVVEAQDLLLLMILLEDLVPHQAFGI